MNQLLVTIIFAGYMFVAGFPVDFDNNDSRDYQLNVSSSPGQTTHFTAYHKTLIKGICSDTCTIEVVGVGTISASSGQTVSVKDGKLSKR